MKKLLLAVAFGAGAFLLSGCDVIPDVQVQGSLVPAEEFISAEGYVDTVADLRITVDTDCDTPVEGDDQHPASGSVVLDAQTFTVTAGSCPGDPNLSGITLVSLTNGDSVESGTLFSMVNDVSGINYFGTVMTVEESESSLSGQLLFLAFEVPDSGMPGEAIPIEEIGQDGGYAGIIIPGVPVTPVSIVDFVQDQLDSGAFSDGEANPVLNHLDQLQKFEAKGQLDKAQKKLDNLIDRAERNAGDPAWDELLTQLQAINPLG